MVPTFKYLATQRYSNVLQILDFYFLWETDIRSICSWLVQKVGVAIQFSSKYERLKNQYIGNLEIKDNRIVELVSKTIGL